MCVCVCVCVRDVCSARLERASDDVAAASTARAACPANGARHTERRQDSLREFPRV